MKQISGGVTAPKGFVAGGVHCGVKTHNKDKKDLALILSERECTAAAVYTMNRVKAAPIYVTMDHLENGEAQAIVANSGNANACAPNSHEHAQPGQQQPDSTGVIGLVPPSIAQKQPLAGRARAGGSRENSKPIMCLPGS